MGGARKQLIPEVGARQNKFDNLGSRLLFDKVLFYSSLLTKLQESIIIIIIIINE